MRNFDGTESEQYRRNQNIKTPSNAISNVHTQQKPASNDTATQWSEVSISSRNWYNFEENFHLPSFSTSSHKYFVFHESVGGNETCGQRRGREETRCHGSKPDQDGPDKFRSAKRLSTKRERKTDKVKDDERKKTTVLCLRKQMATSGKWKSLPFQIDHYRAVRYPFSPKTWTALSLLGSTKLLMPILKESLRSSFDKMVSINRVRPQMETRQTNVILSVIPHAHSCILLRNHVLGILIHFNRI